MQGHRRCVKEKPVVWVNIVEVILPDEVVTNSFSPVSFCWRDVRVRAEVEVSGNNRAIMQEIGSEAALKLMDKVDVISGPRRGASELTGKSDRPPSENAAKMQSTSLIPDKERKVPGEAPGRVNSGGGESWEKGGETKCFVVSGVAVFSRDGADADVKVTLAAALEAHVQGATLKIQSEGMQQDIEDALSKQATEVLCPKEDSTVAPPQ